MQFLADPFQSFDEFLLMFSVFSEKAPREMKVHYAFKIYGKSVSVADRKNIDTVFMRSNCILHRLPICSLVNIVYELGLVQGESGGLGLGYVDSVPSQDNLQMRRN